MRGTRERLALLGILCLAFGLRVHGIADDGYWLDEVTSLHDASKPVFSILRGSKQPGHPPLYYLMLKGWIALFGTSETAVRLLSATFGTAAVGATFALFRALHGRAAGLAASLLLALSFRHVVFSQEARSYALFGFLAVASAWALWRALSEGGRGRWAAYVLCALLMVYTHHQAYFVLLGLAAGAVLARPRTGALRGLALADLGILAAAAPGIVLYLLGIGDDGTIRAYRAWQPRVAWRDLVDVAVAWTPGAPLFAPGSSFYGPAAPEIPWQPWLPLALVLPVACLAFAWARAPSPSAVMAPRAAAARPPPVLFHAATLLAGAGAFVVLALARPIWHPRYVLVFLPFHLGALAAPLVAMRRPARVALVLALVALSVPGLVEEKRRPGRTPWREAAAFLDARQEGAVLLVGRPFLAAPLRWYCKRPFEVVPGDALVEAAERARGRVFVVHCDEYGSSDPGGALEELVRTFEPRGSARFGPIRVHEFAGR